MCMGCIPQKLSFDPFLAWLSVKYSTRNTSRYRDEDILLSEFSLFDRALDPRFGETLLNVSLGYTEYGASPCYHFMMVLGLFCGPCHMAAEVKIRRVIEHA